MRTFLNKVEILNYKYSKLEQYNQFNVFSILRKKDDEVNLHSRFISHLLNPKGKHGLNNFFLEDFLHHIQLEKFNSNDAKVFREWNNIDILITNKQQAIIIENKIHAEDQDQQLERYFKTEIA